MTALTSNRAWLREEQNPLLAPGPNSIYGATICMNPAVIKHNDRYFLFYAADDRSGKRTIRLVSSPVAEPRDLQYHGVMVENGPAGSFDAAWCVLPQIVEVKPGHWHMYYTGNKGYGEGLSAFAGIGLAVSNDLLNWQKVSEQPVLTPAGEPGLGDAAGIAGGSCIMDFNEDGEKQIVNFYTVCPTTGDDLFLDQQKQISYAVSRDGINWEKKGCLLQRNPAHDYENIAVAGPVVRKDKDGYEMWYSAIGTRWGFYSICYAQSTDGIQWSRGQAYGENLQLGPFLRGLRGELKAQTWDSQMVSYPAVIKEGQRDRLFYCGNAYGEGGIGTVLSAPLRAAATGDANGSVNLWPAGRSGRGQIQVFASFALADSACLAQGFTCGLTGDTDLWLEKSILNKAGDLICQLRVLLIHNKDGLEIRYTVHNKTGKTLSGLRIDVKISKGLELRWTNGQLSCFDVKAYAAKTFAGYIKPVV